ncbi:PIR protein [Plasmodium vivax]|uniref:VIR protein n=1 Tax=Plasmodium vivax TaxID=5855 RepID=A0A565A6A0_PLAVI|nr:PIR protein [Plasmodium vivax]
MSLTSSTSQYSPISIAQGYDFLKQLPLYQFYENLKSISAIQNDNHTECETLNDSNELQKICYQLGNILGKITQINKLVDVDNNNNNNRSCKYLNYFIQEQIEKVKPASNNLSTLYEALNKYKGKYEDYKCNFQENTKTDTDIAKISKELYYYAEYLYWIKKNIKNIENTKEIKYSQFFSAFVLYYNRLLQHDTCNDIKEYQTELNEFKGKYNEALAHIKTKYKDISTRPMDNVEEAKKSFRHPLQFIRDDSGDTIQAGTPEDSQGSTVGKATPIICSAVAIFMSSFMLHKFTPLGTYLRRNKLIDRNRMDEKQDDNYKLLSDTSRIPHNIAYQPVGN